MESYKKLLLANKAWIKERIEVDEEYFINLSKDQQPEFLWIGCSDSRVPAEEITGTSPGELFVHRNIANLVVHTDFNLLSVLQYAVEYLKVKNIIVCGHYNCGGVKAAMTHARFGLLNKWLRNIKEVYRMHESELKLLSDPDKRTDRLIELNVIEQVHNLTKSSIVQRAWHEHNRPTIHGWVYDMRTGQLKDLTKIEPGTKIEDIFMFDYSDIQKGAETL